MTSTKHQGHSPIQRLNLARSPRVAHYFVHLPLANAAAVIPGASTRENVELRGQRRQRLDLLDCGPTWGRPGDGEACRCGTPQENVGTASDFLTFFGA
jgi:hypothetical protein